MSTMTNINQKYPITVRKDSIDLKLVPQELIFDRDDNRRHNRILCEKDLVTWYINSKVESKEEDKSITKLFDSNLKKFDLVFTYPWENTHFKIGHVLLSRFLVSVNPNEYDIPKDLIKPAILHSLGLSNLIEYNNVPDFYLEQIKSIVDNSNLDVRKVPNMLNYLQNHLDPRMRYLPVVNGMKPDFVYIAHALVQPNFRVENLMEESSPERGQNKEITEACINLIRYCQINNIPYHKMKDLAQSFKINDYPLLKLLENTDENKYTRFVKGVVGLKISALIERDGITYYPAPTNIYESNHTNSIGTEFKRLNGSETVYFESSISKGFFVHNADALLSVTINRTTLNELIYVLSKIRNKLSSLMGSLRIIARCLPKYVRQTIYNSLVKPHILYLVELWGSASKTKLADIQIAQNKIIKILFHYPYLTPTSRLYKETKLMNIKQLYVYTTCMLVRKILDKKIHSNISLKKNTHSRSGRRPDQLSLPNTRTNYGRKTITYEGAKLYNTLPLSIRNVTTILEFKMKLTEHIVNDSSLLT